MKAGSGYKEANGPWLEYGLGVFGSPCKKDFFFFFRGRKLKKLKEK